MWQNSQEIADESLFLAGQRVPPGVYREISTNREVCFEQEDTLPASLDGRVACYVCVSVTRQPPPAPPLTAETYLHP
mgnify:CR=1 FL=1